MAKYRSNAMNGRFTSELWQGIGDIYRGILVHPFLTGG